MAMVAVGGSIGTGLLLGSGAAMAIAGPAAIIPFWLPPSFPGPSLRLLANSPAPIPRREASECTANIATSSHRIHKRHNRTRVFLDAMIP